MPGEELMSRQIAEAARELECAQEAYMQARMVCEAADGKKTAAVNRFNDAQKKLDQLMMSLRSGAPRESEWHSQRMRGQMVKCD